MFRAILASTALAGSLTLTGCMTDPCTELPPPTEAELTAEQAGAEIEREASGWECELEGGRWVAETE